MSSSAIPCSSLILLIVALEDSLMASMYPSRAVRGRPYEARVGKVSIGGNNIVNDDSGWDDDGQE